MDYREFVAAHRAAGADITVAALPCAEEQAQAFGLMKIDDSGRIVEFAEKPKGDALKAMQVGGCRVVAGWAGGWVGRAL
jgi:glucose-1-phosphate adenylyltransferase